MYEQFFGFTEKPFTTTPDSRFFFPSEKHSEALNSLLYAINERKGFVVITGEIGAGKTDGERGDDVRVDGGGKFDLLEMDVENLDAALAVGFVDEDLPVETACA